MALFLGLAHDELADNPLAAEYLSGNAPLPGSGRLYAQNYGGHQFGEWAGQLGDGRAVTLGEVPPPEDRPEYPRVDLQLKGAGPTPYARDGDGRAVLRSSLREFIASEAMGALGVPTTRCLSLALTGGGVLRDGRFEAGAVVARVAPSFVRFGTFQLPPSRGDVEARALCEPLVAHVLRRHMPAAAAELDAGTPPALAMLRETTVATAATVAAWQALGFAHGVLNTDNMSVLGLTLDYGPFAFVERFDPNFTPNLGDRDGRYAFIRQPEVAGWNLRRFGDALTRAGLVSARQAKEAVDEYDGHLRAAYYTRLGASSACVARTTTRVIFFAGFSVCWHPVEGILPSRTARWDASDPSPPRPVPPRATTRCWRPWRRSPERSRTVLRRIRRSADHGANGFASMARCFEPRVARTMNAARRRTPRTRCTSRGTICCNAPSRRRSDATIGASPRR